MELWVHPFRYTQDKATKAIADLKARKNELGKNLNTRAMGVLSQVEEQVGARSLLLIHTSPNQVCFRCWG